jgi:hypothetical protein
MAADWILYQGRSVGKWRLESFLGDRDGKGFYVGRSEHSPQQALIKLMPSAGGEAEAIRASWERAKPLSHENILRVHEIGDADFDGARLAYGVFDLPDDDLGEMLTGRTLPTEQGRPIFSSIAKALDYLHGRDLQHGALTASNVFLAGSEVRLGVDSVSPAGAGGKQSDMRQFGTTLVRAFTGRSDAVAQLRAPFKEIAAGCLDRNEGLRWTAARVLAVLSGRPAQAAPQPTPIPARPAPIAVVPTPSPAAAVVAARRAAEPSKRTAARWPIVAAAAIPALLIGYWFMGKSSQPEAAAPQPERPSRRVVVPSAPEAVDKKPDPTHSANAPVRSPELTPARKPEPPPRAAAPARQPAIAPRPVAPKNPASTQSGSWAVIAATYSNYGAAASGAEKMRQQSPQLRPHVFPEEGQGRQYYVVLGSGLTQDAAAQLLGVARQHGAPKDAYVSKIDRP